MARDPGSSQLVLWLQSCIKYREKTAFVPKSSQTVLQQQCYSDQARKYFIPLNKVKTLEMPVAQNSQAQYCLSLRIVLVSSECRQTPCLQECRALVCLGFYSVWVAAESTPRVRFSAVHPVCGITQRGAPSADHSQSFLNCKSSLSWVVGPCSHSTALWLLPRRPCLLSRGNTTP